MTEAKKAKRRRGKRGQLRSVEVTIRFETSYAARTIESLISDAITGTYHQRRCVVEGDEIRLGIRRVSEDD